MPQKIRPKAIVIVIISFILIIYALNHLNLPLNPNNDLNYHNSNINDFDDSNMIGFNLEDNNNNKT